MKRVLSVLGMAGLLAAALVFSGGGNGATPVYACGTYQQGNYHDDSINDFDDDDHATDYNVTINGNAGTIEQDMTMFEDGCNNHYYRTAIWEEGFNGFRYNLGITFGVTITTTCSSATSYNSGATRWSSNTSWVTPARYQVPWGNGGCALYGGPGPHAKTFNSFILPNNSVVVPGFEENEGDTCCL